MAAERARWMPQLPLILALVSAVLIVAGRVGKRWPLAIAGYVVLGIAALLVLLGRGT